jgi:hypothetical protein
MRKSADVSSSVLGAALAAILFGSAFVSAQVQAPPGAAAKTTGKTNATDVEVVPRDTKAKAWVMPRTPDGHPDLHGYWTSLTFTPMERPAKYGNREFLTDKEIKEVFDAGVHRTFDASGEDPQGELFNPNSADYDVVTFGLAPWQNGVKPNPRTSLIVDPPDGRIPPLTPEAKAAREAGKGISNHGNVVEDHHGGAEVHADVPTDLGVRTSCVSMSGGPPIVPGEYNSGVFILQSPGHVAIEAEYGTEVRIVSLDGRPHASASIRQWHGDARGHWEGDTLVVETTNFRPEDTFRNANPKTLKITERFTRVSADRIDYRFTVNDPSTWTRPWTAVVPLSTVKGPLFEYDCSENDLDAVNIMAGARIMEKAAAEKAKKDSSGGPISQK